MKLRAKRGVKCTQAPFSMRKKLRHRDTIYGSFVEGQRSRVLGLLSWNLTVTDMYNIAFLSPFTDQFT